LAVKLDLDDGKITDTRLPTNTAEYNNILLQPVTIRGTQAANIFHTCFMTSPPKNEDRFSPIFSMHSVEFFPKNLVTAWLNCNFQRSNLESLLFETNTITILSFISQNDSTKLRALRMFEENVQNERALYMTDAHKTKAKTTVEGLGKIENIYCIVKIAANICGFIRAFFDIESSTCPVIYELCIQIIDCITQHDFTRWHSTNKECLPHLPYLFLNMIQHVFTQQAKFLANTLNTNKVEHGNNGSTLNVKQLKQTVKYILRFFKKMSDHVAEDSTPNSVPRFTPCHALPSNQVCTFIDAVATVAVNAGDTKKKQDFPPPGTPACERRAKKACGGNKPMGGGPDQAKLGLFHAKEGVKPKELFPGDLETSPCAFFCSQEKRRNRPCLGCPPPHIVKWENIKRDDQKKILMHFAKTGNGWFDAETMQKHKAEIPAEYSYLLEDARGPKARST
jgi:hypothetical protein